MPEQPISIMSVNVHHDNLVMHALLQSSPHDILLIQEPWIGSIQTARSDSDPLGSAIAGAAANSLWECPYLPSFTDPSSVHMAIYIKIDISRTFSITNHIDHPIASPESMVFDISFESEILRLVNIYHCVPRDGGHNLLHLLSSMLDPLIPTLLMGNFNTHSHIWSLPSAMISPWANALVDWFDKQGLKLLNPHCLLMWNSSRDDHHLSILDLALLNEAGAISGQISPLSISFQDSFSLDHAALILTWHPTNPLRSHHPLPSPATWSMTPSVPPGLSRSPHSLLPLSSTLPPSSQPLTTFIRTLTWQAQRCSLSGNILTLMASAGRTKLAQTTLQWFTIPLVPLVSLQSTNLARPLPTPSEFGLMISFTTPLLLIYGLLQPGTKAAL